MVSERRRKLVDVLYFDGNMLFPVLADLFYQFYPVLITAL
jgi:hypothetical protein